MKVRDEQYSDSLHLFVLASFAVAQPLYDLLGANPEFFISHRAGPGRILTMMGLLSIGLPMVLVMLERLCGLAGRPLRRGLHDVWVFGLATLIALPPAKFLGGDHTLLIVGMAVSGGGVFIFLYKRWEAVRLFVTVLTPAVLVFPLYFLVNTASGQLVMPHKDVSTAEIEIGNPVPVIFIVLDEFNVTALLDASRNIDPIRFPNFAALAKDSWWFPNAAATSGSTERAVPAILTGRYPQPDEPLSPTATDHPHNLFRLLGHHYRFNVFETLTSLCPDVLCRHTSEAIPASGYGNWVKDLGILYLHLMTPLQWTKALPSLDARWSNFGAVDSVDFSPPADDVDSQLLPSRTGREYQLDAFLSGITGHEGPALHFLHVLLPHVTYEYLASGHKYFPGEGGTFPSGIMDEGVGWTGDESLILTAYAQYLQQIGFVDRFLGRLTERLVASQLYEDALIVVTADHGVAFQRGESRRGVQSRNAIEILRVPLFVKLPGQQEGRIDEQLVSSIDIVPTIADVLQISTPWTMDGRSLFAADPPRTEVEFPGVGVFRAKELEAFARLEWQIAHFGMHSPLSRLVPQGPSPALIGKHVGQLQVGPTSALQFHGGDMKRFEHVRPESGFLPALLRASIVQTEDRNLPIAVAVDGRIWTTTTTSMWDGNANFFSVLLPPEAFHPGYHAIDVYLIGADGQTLLPIASQHESPEITFRADPTGRMELVYPDGRNIPVHVQRGVLHGNLDSLRVIGNMLVFTGWGADTARGEPAAEVLVFSGEELVSRIPLDSRREDVADAHREKRLLHSGFNALVPIERFHAPASQIRVVLVSSDDKTLGLSLTQEQYDLLKGVLE